MLIAHKKVWPFLRISASIQFMSFDVRVSYNSVHSNDWQAIRRLHLKYNLLRFMVWVNSIKFL